MLSIALTFLGIEFYFKNFYAESDNLNTLARQNWNKWYFQDQKNSFGYRDREWTDELLQEKFVVVSAGDSFVYGAGIAKMEDRYSDILAQKLGTKFAVINIGRPGANTKGIIENIKSSPHKPDVIILSYYMNDIESKSTNCLPERGPIITPPKFLLPLIENSYAINFFYWRVARGLESMRPNNRIKCLIDVFNDKKTWDPHKLDLLSIHDNALLDGIELFVVVFPHMYLDIHEDTSGKVVQLFAEQEVPVVDVYQLIKDMPLRDRVPSLMDLHASELVNSLIADELYEKFVETGVASQSQK